MSTRIPHGLNDLHTQLVLRGDEQDSTHVAEKIAAWHAKFLLGEVPRKTRERRGKGERIDGVPRVLSYLPALHTVRREVVRIAPAPRGLRPHAPRRLANRRGTRALTNPHTPVGSEPATTDTARALPEHPPMLYASQGFRGPLLASRPLSFLESGEAAEACGAGAGANGLPPVTLYVARYVPLTERRFVPILSIQLPGSLRRIGGRPKWPPFLF